MERLFRAFIQQLIRRGSLEITTASGHTFSAGDGTGEDLALQFEDQGALVQLMLHPTLYFGELFMNGRMLVTRGTVYDVLVLAARNLVQVRGTLLIRAIDRVNRWLRPLFDRNNEGRSRSNVAHHYDLDGRFYALFLDSDRQYSCAYFERDTDSLDDAQLAKKRHIAAKLMLSPDHRVLDIGCGWGGMALYLARYCGAKVTGVTLSEEQLGVARARADESNLAHAADFRLQDYRAINERFDRIVSVGMFEHVGRHYYEAYFEAVARLLDDDGVALIHTIGRAGGPWPTNPWIAKYIFPGGHIPALSEILPSIERAGLVLTDVEVLRLHYAETLKAWRERFMARREEASALYDDRFCRMWEFYLAGSECSFRYEGEVVFQLQIAKKVDTLPLTRNYLMRREADLRRKDSNLPGLRIAGE